MSWNLRDSMCQVDGMYKLYFLLMQTITIRLKVQLMKQTKTLFSKKLSCWLLTFCISTAPGES